MAASAAIVAHGGSEGSKSALAELERAADSGLQAMASGSALDGVVAAVVALEDCGAFNAGAGADVRLDGARLELDASVMDSAGALGAIAGLTRTRNPVLAAREVARTPHWLLAGAGADRFAALAGLPQDARPHPDSLKRQRELLERLARTDSKQEVPGYDNRLFERYWNYPENWHETVKRHGCGTVGAVARDASGGFAVATSTGGSAPCLWGRVGDSPIIGAGFFAGPAGAIGCTGVGEFIVRELLASKIYGWIESGTLLQEALERGVGLFDRDVSLGVIGITATEAGYASNRDMPAAVKAR